MINEIFSGIQGEGKTQGQYRQFIRVNTCNLSCKFCDTRYTWGRGDKTVKLPKKLNKHIVITGGEPCISENWDSITKSILCRPELEWVEVETNGTGYISIVNLIRLQSKVNLWNISPKNIKDMTHRCIVTPHLLASKEYLSDYIVKFVIKDEFDLEFVKKTKKKYKIPKEKIWLMPYTTPREEELNKAISEKVYDMATDLKCNFSARLHVLIKGNKRGI